MSNQYQNGQYTATGLYAAGKKNIIVKLDLKDDKIAAVEVTPTSDIRMSLGLQKKFALAVPVVVIGKKINDVHLDKLAGSSLTTKGFNDALEQVKKLATK